MAAFPGHEPSRSPLARRSKPQGTQAKVCAEVPFLRPWPMPAIYIDDLLPNDGPIRAAVAKVECLRTVFRRQIQHRYTGAQGKRSICSERLARIGPRMRTLVTMHRPRTQI